MEDHFLSKKQVCALVCKGPTTIWRDVKQGRFPAPKQIGKLRVAWLASSIKEWMDSQPTVGTHKAA